MDPSMIPEITYHSRRKDNSQNQSPNTSGMLFYGNHSITQEEFSYGPVTNVAKRLYQQQQNDHQPQSQNHTYNNNNNNTYNYTNRNTNNQQSITKQFYLQNPSNYKADNKNQPYQHNISNKNSSPKQIHTNTYTYTTNLPSFSNLVPINQQSKDMSYRTTQQSQLRQKIKSLTEHLKSALQANNDIQQKCNGLKCRLQQKQQQHMNQLSLLKAQLIISQNSSKQQSAIIEQYTKNIVNLQQQLKLFEQKQLKMNKQLQKLIGDIGRKQNQIEQLKVKLNEYELRSKSEQIQMKRMMNIKDRQIQQLRQQQQQLSLNLQHSTNEHQHHIHQLQQQLNNYKKSYQTLLVENANLTRQSQSQRDRITQLNSNINQICQQSQDMFGQVNELRAQNNQLLGQINKIKRQKGQICQQNELLNEKMLQYKGLQQQLLGKQDKLRQLMIVNQDVHHHNQDLITKCNILQQQYTRLSENHTNLQEQNILINKNNSSLIVEIQLLNSQIRQLKQVILNQSMKESQLQMKVMEERGGDLTRRGSDGVGRRLESMRERNSLQYKTTKTQQQQPTRQFNNYKNSNNSKQQQHAIIQVSKQQKNITEPDLQQNILLPTSQPYSQYLSFEIPPHNRRVVTCAAQAQRQELTIPLSQLPLSRRHQQLKSRSKSTYPDFHPFSHQQQPKSSNNNPTTLPNNTLPSQRSTSLHSMRYSLDLRQKSVQLKKASQQLYKQSQSHLNKNVYNYNSHQNLNHESGKMFFNKLDRMKVWASQQTTQNNTQREPLDELQQISSLSNTSYLINRDIPVHTIIKQKSSVINNQRKNLLNFSLNVNSQMVQKNILKLQKTNNNNNNISGQSSNSNRRTVREDQNNLTLNLSKENNLSDLSPICEEMSTNKKQKQTKNSINNNNKLTSAIYNNCKKVLYNHTEN